MKFKVNLIYPLFMLIGGIVLLENGKWFHGAHTIGIILVAIAGLSFAFALLLLLGVITALWWR